MPSDLIQVQTTVACLNTAQAMAEQILAERLAACVQISSAVTSHYV